MISYFECLIQFDTIFALKVVDDIIFFLADSHSVTLLLDMNFCLMTVVK